MLDYTTVYPTPPRSDVAGTQRTLAGYVRTYGANVIVIGNGTGSRETEEVVADLIARTDTPLSYTIVNEAGARCTRPRNWRARSTPTSTSPRAAP
nr:hypothetical protein [Eggerthella sinensis]